MAITTVNSRYEGFIFDGENSRDYGIYVQDVKVFGAPTRDVEMISIPGRDGEFALDKGRFNNIQVVYTCAFGADSKSDFNTGISDFRNWLASRKGYKRLEDEINTAEYRMAVFKNGLDVSTLNKETGTFEVTFDCKPQRFLKSGETAQEVTSGGTITNPTLFEARPLLQVWGYGDIAIGGGTVEVRDAPFGEITISNSTSKSYGITDLTPAAVSTSYDIAFSEAGHNAGDTITVNGATAAVGAGLWQYAVEDAAASVSAYTFDTLPSVSARSGSPMQFNAQLSVQSFTFTAGTAESKSATFVVSGTHSGSTITVATGTLTYAYDGAGTITCTFAVTRGAPYQINMRVETSEITVYSTATASPPLYVDLDIGEAYKLAAGEIINANNVVALPSELPVLAPGANTITFDNTVQTLKIVPRWWEV